MALLFPNPSSSDGADKFNYKWMVLLLLVLSLVSFLTPLLTIYQDPNTKTTATTEPMTFQTNDARTPIGLPTVRVQCWCPSHFKSNHVSYVNSYCGNRFNAMIMGEVNTIYYPLGWQNRTLEFFKRKREKIEIENDAAPTQKDGDLKARVEKMTMYQTPIMLLVVGLCLALPHAVWAFLSDCLSSVNIGKTLEAAEKVSLQDCAGGRQALEMFSKDITNNVRSSTASVLYLFKKFLSMLIVLALLLIITQHAHPEVEKLQDEITSRVSAQNMEMERMENSQASETDVDAHEVEKLQDEIRRRVGAQYNKDMESKENSQASETDVEGHDPYSNFFCDFEIRQLQDTQRFTVMCSVANVEEGIEPTPVSFEREQNLLEFESTMFKLVTGALAILFVCNVVSTVNWVSKLACGLGRSSLGVTGNKAMDILFLVHMARINASATVCQIVQAKSLSGENVNLAESNLTKLPE